MVYLCFCWCFVPPVVSLAGSIPERQVPSNRGAEGIDIVMYVTAGRRRLAVRRCFPDSQASDSVFLFNPLSYDGE
eukprot:scaffold696_cov197-Alexandrium_tamarense.AAC.11